MLEIEKKRGRRGLELCAYDVCMYVHSALGRTFVN